MNRIEGMDGHCGNFNGDATDDSVSAITSRFPSLLPESRGSVPADLNFFDELDWSDKCGTVEVVTPQNCNRDYDEVQQECTEMWDVVAQEFQFNACVVDACRGEPDQELADKEMEEIAAAD